MNTLAITLVRLAFRGDPTAADIITDYLDGTRALGDLCGAWRSAVALAPYSDSPIGRAVRLCKGARSRSRSFVTIAGRVSTDEDARATTRAGLEIT